MSAAKSTDPDPHESLEDELQELMEELMYPSLDPDHDLSWSHLTEDEDSSDE